MTAAPDLPGLKVRRLFDAKGLYLEISPAGGRWWRIKYRFQGKERRLSLGVFPDVSLADARARCDEARKLLAAKIDPSAQRKADKHAATMRNASSFEAVAREWYKKQTHIWVSHHASDVLRRLENNLFPARVALARTIKCDAAYDAKIMPKEVLLQTMRNAWHDHKGLREAAILADEVAQQCWEDARALMRGAGESDSAFKARKEASLQTAEHAAKKAREARQAAEASLNLALECAYKAAPYEHPRLVTATVQNEPVTVVLREFPRPR